MTYRGLGPPVAVQLHAVPAPCACDQRMRMQTLRCECQELAKSCLTGPVDLGSLTLWIDFIRRRDTLNGRSGCALEQKEGLAELGKLDSSFQGRGKAEVARPSSRLSLLNIF